MIDLLERHREPIIGALTDLIDASAAEADRVSPWAADLRSRLIDFAVRGKLFRGAIVAAIAEAFHGEPGEDLYRVAAAVELIQSFLLIHDDIMDEDALRRGEPAIFEQYRRLGERDGYTGSNRFGESMGICLGDFTALLAIGAIANCRLEPSLRSPEGPLPQWHRVEVTSLAW